MILTVAVVVALVLWGIGFLLIVRVPRVEPSVAGEALPTVSVIIPARDEERTLPELLSSLASQTVPPLEVLVADDDSTDGTAAIAKKAGARVIPSGNKPPRWKGKTWPCYRGATRARGELLLFLDADTRLAPDAIERLVATHRRHGGLVSVEPHHQTKGSQEQLSAYFEILRAAAVGAFGLGRRRPRGAFGRCLLMRRDEYLDSGGHARPEVRGQMLEGLFLGRCLLRQGTKVTCLGGAGVITTREYTEGWGQIFDRWSKAFATGAATMPLRFVLLCAAWLQGGMVALLGMLAALVMGNDVALVLSAVVYALYALQVHFMLRAVGRFSPLTAVLYPLPLLGFFFIHCLSLYQVMVLRRVTWRGQEIQLTSAAGGERPR